MSEFILQIEKLTSAIGDPEYRFILMEPLIFYGILFGIIIFITSFFMRVVKFQTVALIIVALSALAHIPYTKARDLAQPRMEQVYKISSPARVKMFEANTVEWKEGLWVFLILAVVAGATILVGSQRNRLGLILAIATVFFGLYGVKNSLWLHYQDSLAYHPNLKKHDSPIEKRRTTASSGISVPKANPKPKPIVAASSTPTLQPYSTRPVTPVHQLRIPVQSAPVRAGRTTAPAPPIPQPIAVATRPAVPPTPQPVVATTRPAVPQHTYTKPLSTQARPAPAPARTTVSPGRIPPPRPPALPVGRTGTAAPAPQPRYQRPMPVAGSQVQYQAPLPVR